MSKATADSLEALHGSLAEAFIAKLKSGEATASDYNVIRQFLKDNGIAAADPSRGALPALTDLLPFRDDQAMNE